MKKVVAVWRFVVDVALRWYHGGVGDLAAGVTFWILVSLPASILALLAAVDWLESVVSFSFSADVAGDIEANVVDFVERVFVDDEGGIAGAVRALFDSGNNPSLLTVSLAVTLWSISRGFAGLIRALDDIYGVEDGRPWYHTRVVAIVLGLGSLLISVPLVLMERLVWANVPNGPIEETLRAVVAMAVLVLWAQMIYHFGPSQRSRWLHDLPGALVAAVLWWILSVGFGSYVGLTSSANGVTAAVGAGLLALTWLWLAAQVLLIGGAVNYLWAERFDINRQRRSWSLNEKIRDGTGELRRIVVPGTVAERAVEHVSATLDEDPADATLVIAEAEAEAETAAEAEGADSVVDHSPPRKARSV
ncbi:MAG: YihY/virulence factor BrkB family protein [Actinomycetota bacterium]